MADVLVQSDNDTDVKES